MGDLGSSTALPRRLTSWLGASNNPSMGTTKAITTTTTIIRVARCQNG